MFGIVKKQSGDRIKYPICGECREKTFTIEMKENDNVLLHCANCNNTISFDIMIEDIKHRCESYRLAYDAILEDLGFMEKKIGDITAERDRIKEAIKEFSDKWKYYDSKTITGLDDLRAALREVDGGKD